MMANKIFLNDWAHLLEDELKKPYYLKLRDFLKKEYAEKAIYPNMHDIFNAFHFTPFEEVKVVLLGQDPYHGPDQAHGLSFSVNPSIQIPPSLNNIFKELKSDLGCRVPNNGHLVNWAKQGVLLLNTVLTVQAGVAHSHRGKGWETFTDQIISHINERSKPAVFILWGRPAQQKIKLINTEKHRVIQAPHPSPLSAHRGFFGSKPFSKTNAFLQEIGEEPLVWQIPNI